MDFPPLTDKEKMTVAYHSSTVGCPDPPIVREYHERLQRALDEFLDSLTDDERLGLFEWED